MHQHLSNINTATATEIVTNAASTNWFPYQTLAKKSLSCPYCTPRCPHGYPVETSPAITWTYPNVTVSSTQGINTTNGFEGFNKAKV